jgi:hypothetical protein
MIGQLSRRRCHCCRQETWHARKGMASAPRPWRWLPLRLLMAWPLRPLLDPWRCVPCTDPSGMENGLPRGGHETAEDPTIEKDAPSWPEMIS